MLIWLLIGLGFVLLWCRLRLRHSVIRNIGCELDLQCPVAMELSCSQGTHGSQPLPHRRQSVGHLGFEQDSTHVAYVVAPAQAKFLVDARTAFDKKARRTGLPI